MPKSRVNNQNPPPFEGEIEKIGMKYLRNNHWRIASMYDRDDLRQEAYLVYLRQLRKYPKMPSRAAFIRLYRTNLWGRIQSVSAWCFPNPYNMGLENRCYSMTQEDGDDVNIGLGGVVASTGLEVESYLELLEKLPKELHEAFMLLVREFTGLGEIEIQETVRLNGKMRREGLSEALARAAGLDLKRDVVEEIGRALGVVSPDEIGKALSVLSIGEVGWVLSTLPISEISKTLIELSEDEPNEGDQSPCLT